MKFLAKMSLYTTLYILISCPLIHVIQKFNSQVPTMSSGSNCHMQDRYDKCCPDRPEGLACIPDNATR